MLREATVKVGLEKMDIYKGITVKGLLDNSVTDIVISLEFVRKQGFKLKKVKKLIYVRNVDGIFNKKEPIDHTVEMNIFDQGHRERIEIDGIGEIEVECHFRACLS